MRIVDFFDRAVALHGHRPALDDGAVALTYAEAGALTHRLANALRDAGLEPGAKVALLSPNASMAMVGIVGLLRAGLTWLPLNPRNPVDVNIDLLQRFDGEALIFHSAYAALAPEILRRAPGIRLAFCLDGESEHGAALPSLMAQASDRFPDTLEDPDAVVAIFPTGGTTGASKGAVTTNRQIEVIYANMYAAFDFHEGDRHLIVAPMTHASGLLGFLFFPVGGLNQILAKAEPEKIMAAIQEHRITHLYLPPTVVQMMLSHPDAEAYDYSSLKHFIVAAAPIPTAKFVEAVRVFGPMTEVYGQMESPCTITLKAPRDYRRADGSIDMDRARSAGRPGLFNIVRLFDEEGREAARGERGEICVRGPLTMQAYYKDPEATARTRRDGWIHTGDIGVQDADGFITIVDRKKDMIITGGFNVFPNEIEQVVGEIPCVQDCAVIGVPDEKWGEAVKAVIQLKAGAQAPPEDEMIAYVKRRMGGVAAPKTIDIVDELPRSPNGKVLRRELRERYWQGRESSLV